MTLEELKVLISAETKGYRDEITKIKNQTKQATSQITAETGKIKSSFRSIGKVIAGLAIGASIIKIGKDAVKMAMSVEASIQQVNRLMGDNANKFKQWAKSNALAFNMSQSDALRFGSVYSNLLTSFMDTSDDVFGGTMQLLKSSSIIASGTGRTMEDVMERIRSGLLGNTEAIEDLGVDVRVGMLESTNAFKRFAGDSSWDQLDTKTQQQIRLFAILEQTTQKFGDSVLVNANSSMQQLVAILKDVSLNIGNAFMPIVNIVMPILTGFAMKLREATAYLSTFMSLLFGKKQTASPMAKASQETSSALGNAVSSANGLSSGLGKAASNAKKTAKELGGIASFDDLNILSAPSNSEGGAGSSGGLGGINTSGGGLDWGDDTGEPSIPEIDTSSIQNAVDKVKGYYNSLKEFLRENKAAVITILAGMTAGFVTFFGMKWLTNIGGLAGILVSFFDIPGMAKLTFGAKSGLKLLANTFTLGLAHISTGVTKSLGFIGGLFMKVPGMELATNFIKSSFGKIGDIFKISFSKLRNIATVGIGKISTLFSSLVASIGNIPVIGPIITKVAAVISGAFSGISTAISGVLGAIAGSAALIAAVVAAIVGAFAQLWLTNESWKKSVILAWNNIKSVLSAVWTNVIQPIFQGVVALAITVWEGGLKPLWDAWIKFVDIVSSAFLGLWNFLAPYIKIALEYLGPIFSTAFQVLGVLIGTVLNVVMGVVSSVFNVITGAIEWVVSAVADAKDSFAQILESIGLIFSGITDFIVGVFTLDFEKAISGIINIFKGLWSGLVGIVSGVWNTILGLFANGGKIFSGVVDGIANVFKSIVNTLLTGINKVIAVPFKSINGILNEIRVIDIPLIGMPFKGLWGKNPLPVPQIPYMRNGGVLAKGQTGYLEGDGTEAVVPLEKNVGWTRRIADLMVGHLGGFNEGQGGTYEFYFVMDGDVLFKKVVKNIKDYEKRTGSPVFG